MTAFVRLARPRDWASSKLPFLAAAALLLDVSPERTLLVLATLVPWAAFGYGLNEICDQAQDVQAGKSSRALGLGRGVLGAYLAITATAAFALSLLWSSGVAVAAALALAVSYSAPPLRLKERGAVGVVAGAAAQWALPVLAVASTVPLTAMSLAAVALAFVVGVRWLLVHQAHDADADRRTGARTFGAARSQLPLRPVLAVELVLLATVLVTLGADAAPALLALLPTVAWRRPRPLLERLDGYVDAPLSTYYFCLLPAFLAFAHRSPASLVLGVLVLAAGTPAILGALPRGQLAAARP